MTTLIDQIKLDQVSARKSGDKFKATLLTTLYSESANVGFNDGKRQTTDEEVISVIKKFIKNIDECIKQCNEQTSTHYINEKEILLEYLPKQMSEDELKLILNQLIDIHHGSKSHVMKALKDMCGGKYNGKLASDLYDTMV